MSPCRTIVVSYSWMILAMNDVTGWTFCSWQATPMASSSSVYSTFGGFTPGNRSVMMPEKSGRSWERNLGTFTSRRPRSSRTFSSSSGKSRFRFPAAVMTDLTARIP